MVQGMQAIRVAAVSMNGLLGRRDRNLKEIAKWCRRAADARADLVVFPELVVHGHCAPNTWEVAEPVPESDSVRRIVTLARECALFLAVGLSEKENDIVYNTHVLAGPDGYLGKQRKLHMSRDETFFYKGGHDLSVFDIGKCKIGISICYDSQFPEVSRVLALRGAEVLLMPHAAREYPWRNSRESRRIARRHMFDFYLSYALRARENACFVVLTDQAGRAGFVDSYPRDHINQPHHPGAILVFGPGGELLAHAQTEEIREEMLIVDLDPGLQAKWRGHPNFTLRTRRAELFAELVNEVTPSDGR
jgi:predicted amidohydrolase